MLQRLQREGSRSERADDKRLEHLRLLLAQIAAECECLEDVLPHLCTYLRMLECQFMWLTEAKLREDDRLHEVLEDALLDND